MNAGSRAFVDDAINRDSLEPVPVQHGDEALVQRGVVTQAAADAFSASRGHPVYAVDLPSNTVSISIGDLQPRQQTSNHRHAYESVIYVIAGRGWSIVEGRRVDWTEGDAFYVPPWNWHQHFAAHDEGARYLTATNLPLLIGLGQTVLREEQRPTVAAVATSAGNA